MVVVTSSSSSPSIESSSTPAISTVHSDIIQTHILTHLDGLTLASTACASSHLYSLATDDNLWQKLTSSTWPSINDPRVQHVISTFPSRHRSFFSDSLPLLDYRATTTSKVNGTNGNGETDRLISAVDIFYRGELIFSKIEEMETVSSWFNCSPFRVDLLQLNNDFFLTPDHHLIPEPDNYYKDTWQTGLLKDLTLSWILIDPIKKRAVNLSSNKAVSVERHWLSGEVQVKYAAVVPGGGKRGTAEELVECAVVVTCGRGMDGRVQVSEVGLGVEDMEKRNLSGRESLVILQNAMERVKRVRCKGGGDEGRKRYEEFVEMKRVRKMRKAKRENVFDTCFILIGILVFVMFWWILLFSRK
ncbi:hypothetical protein ACFE04_028802 [Oxalis oulophora]